MNYLANIANDEAFKGKACCATKCLKEVGMSSTKNHTSWELNIWDKSRIKKETELI